MERGHIQLSDKWDIIAWFCSYRAGLHTDCRQVISETDSVCDSAAIKQDHIQAVGGRWVRSHTGYGWQWVRQCKCMVLQLSSKIMYRLWVCDKRDTVSACFCSYQARSHTGCEQAMGEMRQCQCMVLQLSREITYRLWVGDGEKKESGMVLQPSRRLRTDCGRGCVR